MDKPEQALDLLQEAIRMVGLELNKDVGVLIDVGADKLYDQVLYVAYYSLPRVLVMSLVSCS